MCVDWHTCRPAMDRTPRPSFRNCWITAVSWGPVSRVLSPICSLAARKSYQDFLTLWKDADPDIPIYQHAKAEYARLK